MDQDETWHESSLDPGHIVLDADPAPRYPKRVQSPQFSAHVYCGQTATWIKMPLGVEVRLGPGHIVLDGDPAQLPKRGTDPIFGPCLLWPNGCMDQNTTWYEGRPRLSHIVVDTDPAPLAKKEQEGQHPLTGQRAPPISGGTYGRRRTLIDGYLERPFPTACLL